MSDRKIDVTCSACGKTFQRVLSQLKRSTHHFCNRKCYSDYWRKEKICPSCGSVFNAIKSLKVYCCRGCKNKSKKKIYKQCPECGKEMFVYPNKKFCSKLCANLSRRLKQRGPLTGQYLKCEECGGDFYAAPYRIKEGIRFCSQKCAATNRMRVKERHPRWRGGLSEQEYPKEFHWIRNKIKKEFNFTCVLCGDFGDNVHHIDYNKENNEPENFVLLCRSCHAKTNNNRDYWTVSFKILMGTNND